MKITVLVFGTIYLVALGLWVMKKVDAFLQSASFHPYWSKEQEEDELSKRG